MFIYHMSFFWGLRYLSTAPLIHSWLMDRNVMNHPTNFPSIEWILDWDIFSRLFHYWVKKPYCYTDWIFSPCIRSKWRLIFPEKPIKKKDHLLLPKSTTSAEKHTNFENNKECLLRKFLRSEIFSDKHWDTHLPFPNQ